MARWKRGESEVEALIASGELQQLTGDAANGERLLEKASITLQTARSAIQSDPDSAFVLAYDASRQALTAMLAHQGLRPTTRGGHSPSSRPPGPSSARASAVRRAAPTPQRAGIPERPGDDATDEEASQAVENAGAIIIAAKGLLDQLGLF